jgi:hypothetical protein
MLSVRTTGFPFDAYYEWTIARRGAGCCRRHHWWRDWR